MASQAVNINSFLNYIVSVSRYYDGSELSDENKTQLKNYLLKHNAVDPRQVLSVGSAMGILMDLRLSLGRTPISVTADNYYAALSVNTAKALVNVLYIQEDVYKHYTTLYKWFYTNTITTGGYDVASLYNGNLLGNNLFRIDGYNAGSLFIEGYIVGGGGGASGALSGDGDKNASYTIISGAGAAGEDSYISVGTNKVTAIGGAGGASKSQTAGSNPQISVAGASGSDGSQVKVEIYISPDERIKIHCGLGGGGGAGCAASAGGTTGTVTWTAGSGSGEDGGAVVTTAAEWSGEDIVGANGGSGGGGWEGNYGRASTKTYYTGPSGSINAANDGGKNGIGGLSYPLHATLQSKKLGGGGLGGYPVYAVDEKALAYGGSGGNRGGFVVFSNCSAANCLMGIEY